MKLHLPKGLRAALLAAFTGISCTLASATELNTVATMQDMVDHAGINTATVSTSWEMSGDLVYSFTGSNSFLGSISTDALTTVMSDLNANYVTVAAWVNPAVDKVDGDGCAVFSYGGQDDGAKLIVHNSGNLKFTTKSKADFAMSTGATVPLNDWTLVAVTFHQNGGNFDVHYYINGAESTASATGAAAPTADWAIGSGNGANEREQFKGDIGGLTIFSSTDWVTGSDITSAMGLKPTKLIPPGYTWTGSVDANWDTSTPNWVDNNGAATAYTSSATANTIFDTTPARKAVTVKESVEMGSMTVTAGGYTFALQGGVSLTAGTLDYSAASDLGFSGNGTVSVTTLEYGTTLDIADTDTRMSVADTLGVAAGKSFATTGQGTLAVNTFAVSGGTVTIGSNIEIAGGGEGKGANPRKQGLYITNAASEVKLLGALTNITGAMYANAGTVTVGDGSKTVRVETNRVEFGDSQGGEVSTLNILKGGTVHVKAEDNTDFGTTGMLLGEWAASSEVNISGKLYGDNTTAYVGDLQATINIEDGGVMAVKGIGITANKSGKSQTLIVNLKDDGTLVLGENGMSSEKPLTATLGSGEIGISYASVEIGAALTLSDSAETTFNTAMYTWQGSGDTLELLAGDVGGTITVSGNITGDGTLIVKGTGTVAMTGGNNTLTHTIDLQGGTLDVSTAVLDISDISGGSTETTYSDGQEAGNGFATISGTIDVVDVGTGATLSHSGVQVLYNGTSLTMDDNGDVVMEGTKSLAAFYVNVDGSTETLSNAVAKGEGQLTTVDLGNNTTLTADADTTLGSLQVRKDASATVSLSQDLAVAIVTVTTEGKALTLSGEGVLSAGALQGAGNVQIGAGTTLALNGIGTGYAGSFTAEEGGTLQLTTNTAPATLTVNGEGTLRLLVNQGGQNFNLKTVTADNLELHADDDHNSRFVYDNNSNLDGVKHLIFDGAQMWLNGKSLVFDGDVTFNTTTYSEGGNLDKAAIRVSSNGTFSGPVAINDTARMTIFSGNTIEFSGEVTGNGNIELKEWSGNGGTFKVSGDASAYTGAVISDSHVALSVESDAKLTLAGGSNLSGAVAIGGVLTMNSTEGTTSTIGGSISGTGTLNKAGIGTLVLSGTAGTAGVIINVNEGSLKATAANGLGTGLVSVAAGATLDLVNGGALAGTQTVANSGNVTLHDTLTSGTVNGGVLTLASDFPNDGDILDVGDTDTGNGFSQGGVMHVYTPGPAALTGITDIVHGETHYTLANIDENGDITTSAGDWNTYQLNVDAQYTVQAIMDYATGKGGELKTISVNDDVLSIDNDSTTLKTSMLGGEHLATFGVYMSGTSGLTIDADCPAYITANAGAEGTLTLEKDATIGSLTAADAITQEAIQLTITGQGHTLKTDGLAVAFDGTLVLDEGVKLEMLPETAFTSIGNANMVLKKDASLVMPEVTFATVEGGDEAKVVITSDDYLPMYDARFAEYSITGARITYTTSANFDLGHVIDATSQVVNEGTGSLRDISANEEYAELNAKGGDIYISAAEGTDARALIVGDLTLAEGRTVAEDTGKAVSITVNGTAGFGSGATVGAALTMAGGSTLNGQAALANHSLALGTTAGDKLAIGADLWSTLKELTSLDTTNLFTGVSALTLGGTGYTGEVDLTTIFTHDDLKANKYKLSYDSTGKNVVITKMADNNRYWQGGDGTWDYTTATAWKDDDGADAAFSSGYNAYFTGTNKGTVTLGTDITAESITVSGADYTFEPGTHSLTVNKSVEADAHKATFNMTLSGTDLKLIAKNGGTIILNMGGSVKDVEVGADSAIRSSDSFLTVTGEFTNAGEVSGGTLTLTQGTTAGGNASINTLNLTSGQSYTFGNLTANSVNGEGANLAIGTGNTLQVNSSATIGNLALANGAQLASSGTTTVSGTTAINTAASLAGSLTTGALSGTGKLTLNNGSLTFTEATTLTDTDLAFSGTSTITSQGVTLTFKGTLVHTIKGAMTFVGSFDVGNCDTVDGTAVYVEGGSDANGFKQAQKVVSIINGGSANGTNATLTYNGKSIGKMDTDGKVTFQGDTEYDKYYVNSGTEKVSTALNNAKQQLGTFELKGGTTLVVDKNISMGMVNAAGAATLQIDSGKTVTTDGTTKALTLTGNGTLAVDAGKTATGVTLGDTNTWTGTVSFTEAKLTTIADAWGNANSTVALQDTYGSLGTAEVDYDLELRKGTGSNWGFGATAAGDSMVTLYGDLKGAGDFGVKAGTGSSIFILKGSTGDWTGNFVDNSAAGGSTSLVFEDGEKVIHGMVGAVSPGGELSYASNLEVTTVANTTFEKAVQVARLISMSGTTKLQEDSTVGTLSNTANLELAENKTLTIRERLSYGTSSGIFKMGAHSQVALAENATMGYLGDYKACYQGGTITNGTDEQQTFGLDNKNITVDGATIMLSGSAVTVNNVLTNAKADTLAVEQGNVSLNNVAGPLTVGTSLSIGANKTFKVANTDGAAKQTVVMGANSTLTTGIGSKLDADLTLSGNVTTDMAAELAMNGGALTLNKGLTLAGGLYDAVDALSEAGAYVNLFTGVGALTLGEDAYTEPVKALQYFTNLGAFSDRGDYFLKYDGGIVSIYFTPTDARTLTWNGTETEHSWTQDDAVTDWLVGDPATETYFASGDNARFTGDAEKKLVTIAEDITARNITIADSRYIIENDADRTITADQFAVNNAALGKKGEGKLVLAVDTPVSLENGAFAVQAGDVEIGAADSAGALELTASMLDIAPGSTLTVATITADEDSTIELDGTLQVAKGSVMYIEASEGSLLKIADVGTATAGTLAVNTDAYLYGLENHGTLDLGTNELTLMEKTAQGGNVTAGKITLAENGSTFGDLAVNTIQYGLKSADDATLDAENPNLVVDSIAAGGVFPVVTLDISETMHGEGSLAPIQRTGEEVTYTLLHANDGLGTTSFTLNAGALDLLKQNGLLHADAGLVKTENDVTLTIGGLDLTWYTDKDVTEWGYNVTSGDSITHGGNTLNGVEHVVVDASRTIDVTGAGSEPGLRVRNITGLDGRTLAFTGTEDDTVNLVTNEETSSNVNVAAENITVKVGLDEMDEMDPVDYKDLRVGDVNLTSATLDVHAHEGLDDSFTVNSLHGDSGSLLKGTLIVEGQGGDYSGEYEDATVILHANADQMLAADEGLTVMGLGLARITYSGTQTHMDGIEGIGLRVMLNDTATDNSHRTLTLDNEYSYISNGAVGIGLSAVASAATLDTDEAPDLLKAKHLDMSGSTLYIFQAAVDGDTLVMNVNDGGYKRGLLLAHFGAEDTTAEDVQLQGSLFNKYYQNARLEGGKVLVDRNRSFYTDITAPTSENGQAGAGMLDDALLYNNPQVTNPTGDLAAVMTALEQGRYTQGGADKVMASMSGASHAAMGAAWNRDVDRQLRAIRNRTTQMGLAECTHHEGLPYFNAWINAEGDYSKLDADGTLAGYKLTSWGGTLGVDVDCTNRFTMGVAVTAMSGDFTANSVERAEGDLDRLYVSVFGRYTHRAWTHTFVATYGMADTKLKRTVDYTYGSYNTDSSSDGKAFGLMYELGYVTALNEDSSTCLQPVLNLSYRHSSLAGCSEQSSSDAALRLGNADANVFTAAIGARLQGAVGTSVYNRSSIFEGRVMLKFDTGDRDVSARNGFLGVPGGRDAKSTEAGLFGVEVGVGLTIPLSENAGALFFDVTGDFRAKDTEVNGTVGYRYNF